VQLKEVNPLNAKLNPICHLLALIGAHHILRVSRIKVKLNYCTEGGTGKRKGAGPKLKWGDSFEMSITSCII
jgi:hypothetical protein